jgi:hypothetical protein
MRLKLRKALFKLLCSSPRFSPVPTHGDAGCGPVQDASDAAALLLRESTFLRSAARTLIDKQGLLDSGVLCTVREGPSNVFNAFLTALSFPLVRFFSALSSQAVYTTLYNLLIAKHRTCA